MGIQTLCIWRQETGVWVSLLTTFILRLEDVTFAHWDFGIQQFWRLTSHRDFTYVNKGPHKSGTKISKGVVI